MNKMVAIIRVIQILERQKMSDVLFKISKTNMHRVMEKHERPKNHI